MHPSTRGAVLAGTTADDKSFGCPTHSGQRQEFESGFLVRVALSRRKSWTYATLLAMRG